MFFAVPKVKSLSRYAEYGAYLGNRHFLAMLLLAMMAHLTVIAVYSMMPREEVIRIPVRALNIKLAGGEAGNGAMQMPAAAAMPATAAPAAPAPDAARPKPEMMKSVREEETPESAIDKQLEHSKPAHPVHAVPAGAGKVAKPGQKAHHAESVFSTPKQYVRESENVSKGAKQAKAGAGNGSTVSGDAQGKEIATRYTQTISQWIKNHQQFALAEFSASGNQRHIQGQTVVTIRINRDGHIIYKEVFHTSGNEEVDNAAMAMVNASDPVPAVPDDYPSDSQLQFNIPVQVDFSKH